MKKYILIAALLFAVSATAQPKIQPVKAGGFTYSLVQAHFGEVPTFFRGQAGLTRAKIVGESGQKSYAWSRIYQGKAGGFFDLESPDGAQVEFKQAAGEFTAALSYINCDLRRKCESDWFGFWNLGPAIRMVNAPSRVLTYSGATAGFTAASDMTALVVSATWTRKWDIEAQVTQQVQKYVLVDAHYRDRQPGAGVSLAVKNFRLRAGADWAGTKSLTLHAAF